MSTVEKDQELLNIITQIVDTADDMTLEEIIKKYNNHPNIIKKILQVLAVKNKTLYFSGDLIDYDAGAIDKEDPSYFKMEDLKNTKYNPVLDTNGKLTGYKYDESEDQKREQARILHMYPIDSVLDAINSQSNFVSLSLAPVATPISDLDVKPLEAVNVALAPFTFGQDVVVRNGIVVNNDDVVVPNGGRKRKRRSTKKSKRNKRRKSKCRRK
jgi:hypothetical protein